MICCGPAWLKTMNAPNKQDLKHDLFHELFAPTPTALSPERISRYTTFVSGMKVALPLLAIGILVAIMAWSQGQAPAPQAKSKDAIDATMRDAVYESRDRENHPVKLQSPLTKQDPNTPDMLNLTRPSGTIQLGPDKTVEGSATSGDYDQKKGVLELKGDLTLRHSDGTTLKTDSATIDLNTNEAHTSEPVLLQGRFGEVRGQGMEIKEGGKVIVFTGESSAKLKMGTPAGAAAPALPSLGTQQTPASQNKLQENSTHKKRGISPILP